MKKLILSLGSNIGERKKILFSAIKNIEENIGKIIKVSSFYETEPWGFDNENLFLNIAVSLYTDLNPREILNIIHDIENLHGRIRSNKNGYQSRTLDIDIIFLEDNFYYEKDLQIPHIHAHKRKFVLVPIIEIEPKFIHPLLKQTLEELLKQCTDETKIYVSK